MKCPECVAHELKSFLVQTNKVPMVFDEDGKEVEEGYVSSYECSKGHRFNMVERRFGSEYRLLQE